MTTKPIFPILGSYIDVVAPGVDIISTVWNDTYSVKSGTSMAVPYVSGLAALIWAKNPNLSNQQVGAIIVGTADDLGPKGRDNFFGYGRINAAKAVSSATSKSSFQVEEKLLRPEIAFDSNSQFEPGIVLVELKKSLNLAEKIGVLNQFSLDVIEIIEQLDILKLKVEPGTEISNINKLRENPSVEFAEPNYLIHLIE